MRRDLVVLLATLVITGWQGMSLADDCGVRGYDGTHIIKFDCEPAAPASTSRLKVRISTGVRGIKLVDPGTSGASKFRVRYTDTSVYPNADVIKAIGYVLPDGMFACEELQMIGYHPAYSLSGVYKLGSDIDCSATNPANVNYATSLWGMGYYEFYKHKGFDGIAGVNPTTRLNDDNVASLSLANLGAKGFKPIGTSGKSFTGSFDGRSHAISNLFINRSGENYIGLFGATSASIANVGLVNVNATGKGAVGGLAGEIWSGVISDSYVTGNVAGSDFVGGLVGNSGSYQVSVQRAYSVVNVTGTGWNIGGLVGNQSGGSLENVYATGNVRGGSGVGGLVGSLNEIEAGYYSRIMNSYAIGSVTGTGYAGGVVGYTGNGDILNCFSTGAVAGSIAGGIAGSNCKWCGYTVYLNNWWYNTTTSGDVGYVDYGVPGTAANKAPAASAFYDAAHAVYRESSSGAGDAWDFASTWKPPAGGPPKLKWEQS